MRKKDMQEQTTHTHAHKDKLLLLTDLVKKKKLDDTVY